MSQFTIPADFKETTIKKIDKENRKWKIPIKEVYGSLNPSIFGSGRKKSEIPIITFEDLKAYVEVCQDYGLEFNYTLNFNCNSNYEFTLSGRKQIIDFAKKLSSIGVKRFTVVLPSVIDILEKFVPEAKISVSVISNINSEFKLQNYCYYKNVDRINVPEFLNRNISVLKKIIHSKKGCNCEFGTIVNSFCLIDCPFRSFHYSFGSHSTKNDNFLMEEYYGALCALRKAQQPTEILKIPWIRPENLEYYSNLGIKWFKISGREMKSADFLKVVDVYNKGFFEGNLSELLMCFTNSAYSQLFTLENSKLNEFVNRFFENSFECNLDCGGCNYCNLFSELVILNKKHLDYWKQKFSSDFNALTTK